MRINQKELANLGTPKKMIFPKKELSKEEKVMMYLKKHGETKYRELDHNCNLYGHASRVLSILVYDGIHVYQRYILLSIILYLSNYIPVWTSLISTPTSMNYSQYPKSPSSA